MRQHGPGQRPGDHFSKPVQNIYPLPKDTCEIAKKSVDMCPNYGLLMERLLSWVEDKDGLKFAKQSRDRFTQSISRRKTLSFKQEYRKRWEAMLDGRQQYGYEVKRFSLQAASRVVVGLGAESVLETSIRLHRIYGFPVIPGSALKGLARAYALWQVAEELGIPALPLQELQRREKAGERTPIQKLEAYLDEPDENRCARWFEELRQDEAIPPEIVEEKLKHLRAVFGTTASAGKVIFFDAVPANPEKLVLELDVMNPHYSQYYQGGNVPPADYLSPVPVFFITIAPGSEFLFAVASENSDLVQRAQTWLQRALCEVGIGAKTTAGYGLWK